MQLCGSLSNSYADIYNSVIRFLSGGETDFQSRHEHRCLTVSACSQFDATNFHVLLFSFLDFRNLYQTDICIVHFIIISLRKKTEQQTHPQTFLSKGIMETQDLEVILNENITHSDRSFKNIKEVIRE